MADSFYVCRVGGQAKATDSAGEGLAVMWRIRLFLLVVLGVGFVMGAATGILVEMAIHPAVVCR